MENENKFDSLPDQDQEYLLECLYDVVSGTQFKFIHSIQIDNVDIDNDIVSCVVEWDGNQYDVVVVVGEVSGMVLQQWEKI